MRKSGLRHTQTGISRLIVLLFMLSILMPVLLTSCAAPQVQKSQAKGVYHVVKKGETVYSIARAYSISLQDLAEVNNLSDVSNIKEGTVIFIPDASQVIDDVMAQAGKAGVDFKRESPENGKPSEKTAEKPPGPDKVPPVKTTPSTESGVTPPPKVEKPAIENQEDVKLEKGKFVWPVKGVVKTRFGIQPNKTYHNWIKIVCQPQAQVRAADSGTVIFSAGLKDFGETIIVRHSKDFATVYTHLGKRLVKADRTLKKSDVVGLAGEKDEGGETFINFEIRLKGKARNPLFYLP